MMLFEGKNHTIIHGCSEDMWHNFRHICITVSYMPLYKAAAAASDVWPRTLSKLFVFPYIQLTGIRNLRPI